MIQMKFRILLFLPAVIFSLSTALSQDVTYNAIYRVEGKPGSSEDSYRSHVNIESLNNDESAVLAENGARLILTSVRVNKTGGSLSSARLRDGYGVNSAVLATGGSTLLMETPTLNVHVSEADGVTSLGKGTTVTVQGGQFNMSRDKSTALRVTGGGLLKADKVTVSSLGNQSPAVAACQEGSRADITGMKGSTNGISSPLFFSSGELTATNCLMECGASQISTVEGGGKLTLSGCELRGANYCGFLVYSQDGGKGHGGALVSLTSCKLSTKGGPFFYATNTDVSIRMEKNSISNGSKVFLCAQKDDWGTPGENGARVKLQAVKQSIEGDVIIDSISSVRIELGKGSSLNGTVNPDGNPCAEARIFIAKGASWNSRESSYITSVEFEEPVANGVKRIKCRNDIFYKADDPSNAKLEGKEYRLGGGGTLKPLR